MLPAHRSQGCAVGGAVSVALSYSQVSSQSPVCSSDTEMVAQICPSPRCFCSLVALSRLPSCTAKAMEGVSPHSPQGLHCSSFPKQQMPLCCPGPWFHPFCVSMALSILYMGKTVIALLPGQFYGVQQGPLCREAPAMGPSPLKDSSMQGLASSVLASQRLSTGYQPPSSGRWF